MKRKRTKAKPPASVRTVLAGWECPRCYAHKNGFVEPTDYKTRYCGRCMAPMREIHRSAA